MTSVIKWIIPVLLTYTCIVKCINAFETVKPNSKPYYNSNGRNTQESWFTNQNSREDKDLEFSGYGSDDEDWDQGSGDFRENVITSRVLNEDIELTTERSLLPTLPEIPIGKEIPKSNMNDANSVLITNPKSEDRGTSFFAQPGILAAIIGGAVVGLLCAILVVMFIVYRMRKKDERSCAPDESKQSPTSNLYAKVNQREFYA